jgi:hypothetical protein
LLLHERERLNSRTPSDRIGRAPGVRPGSRVTPALLRDCGRPWRAGLRSRRSSEAATRPVGVGVAASRQKQERGREAVGLPGWASSRRLVRPGRPPPETEAAPRAVRGAGLSHRGWLRQCQILPVERPRRARVESAVGAVRSADRISAGPDCNRRGPRRRPTGRVHEGGRLKAALGVQVSRVAGSSAFAGGGRPSCRARLLARRRCGSGCRSRRERR